MSLSPPLNLPVPVMPDTCYILSFAIIMLNTSLHNPCVKDKTTLDRFISMNRGINNGGNLQDELLSVRTTRFLNLYDRAVNAYHHNYIPDGSL